MYLDSIAGEVAGHIAVDIEVDIEVEEATAPTGRVGGEYIQYIHKANFNMTFLFDALL